MTAKNKIPKFGNLAEEAKFWDTHDVTDYLNEMKLVDVEFLPRQKKEDTVTIRIESKLKNRLDNLAASYGVNLSTLTRMWIVEKLRQVA
ncbi:MAG: CopG family antitoxin [Patescibacteria group bacterium]